MPQSLVKIVPTYSVEVLTGSGPDTYRYVPLMTVSRAEAEAIIAALEAELKEGR